MREAREMRAPPGVHVVQGGQAAARARALRTVVARTGTTLHVGCQTLYLH